MLVMFLVSLADESHSLHNDLDADRLLTAGFDSPRAMTRPPRLLPLLALLISLIIPSAVSLPSNLEPVLTYTS